MTLSPTAPVVTPAPLRLSIGAVLTLAPPLPPALRQALLDHFTLANPLFTAAEEHGRSTRDLAPWLFYYETLTEGALVLPRGAIETVYTLCQRHGVTPVWADRTYLAPPVDVTLRLPLTPAQDVAVQQFLRRRVGLLEAPTGSGKTMMAMAIIAARAQPTAFIVHTQELADQAAARAALALGLAPQEIGYVGGGQCHIGDRLTICLIQTLARGIPPALFEMGHIVLDEAHHAPAAMTAAVLRQLPARYITGLSATPFRRDGLGRVIGFYVGPVTARLDASAIAERRVTPRVIKRETGCAPDGDSFTELVSQLATDPARHALIVADVAAAVRQGRCCLVVSERTAHVALLADLLRAAGVAVGTLHGTMPKKGRLATVQALAAGEVQALVATTALLCEGFDAPQLSTLFLTTPVSYEGRVIQLLGRISRAAPGKTDALVVDYCDDHPMLWSAWGKRAAVYRRLAPGVWPARCRSVA